MTKFTIEFPNTAYPPITLEENACLPEALTTENSPLQFGCRNGICATCLVEVTEGNEKLAPPHEEEQDTLDLYAECNPNARLACQLKLTADIKMVKLRPE